MSNRRVLATVILGASLTNRAAIAEQVLRMVQAGDPEGTYVIDGRTGIGALVPDKDEDWEFRIVELLDLGTDTVTWVGTEDATKPAQD